MLAPRPQDRRRVGGGDSAGRNSTFAGAARRDVARIDGVALWRWGGAARGFHRRGPRVSSARPRNPTLADPKPQLGAGFMDPAPTYVGAQSSKPAPTGGVPARSWRKCNRWGTRGGGPWVAALWHRARLGTARARHCEGSAPRGLGTARARHREGGTAKGSAPQRARRKSGSTARTWDRQGAVLPGNDGVGAQAGAPHKRAGSGNRPQRRGPSCPRGQLGPTEQRVLKKRLLRSDYRGNTGSTTRFHEALMTPANDPYQAPIAVAIPRYPPTL